MSVFSREIGLYADENRPVRTFCTACIYYHKFRLIHKETEYQWPDAAAAALLTACKIEDTLKKSREILCAAYNSKVSAAEYLSSDDPVSKTVNYHCRFRVLNRFAAVL